mmetsp:Transcript_55971/g.137196  ORF Transcript_55971/g.137196 Transcript_55971/m.137196 type:complete len:203 (+) Transcript_55971:160-768(+)
MFLRTAGARPWTLARSTRTLRHRITGTSGSLSRTCGGCSTTPTSTIRRETIFIRWPNPFRWSSRTCGRSGRRTFCGAARSTGRRSPPRSPPQTCRCTSSYTSTCPPRRALCLRVRLLRTTCRSTCTARLRSRGRRGRPRTWVCRRRIRCRCISGLRGLTARSVSSVTAPLMGRACWSATCRGTPSTTAVVRTRRCAYPTGLG